MKIERLIDGAIATDGGTISCSIGLEDGTVLECGLDSRVLKTKPQRLIFVGAGYPTLPGARLLARHSPEEEQFIAALQDFVSREPSHKIASMFLRRVLDR
jgi:hypothetical protein